MVQVLPSYPLEDDAKRRSLEVVVETEVKLVAMNCCLKCQQCQHDQVVLQHNKKSALISNKNEEFE